MTDQPFFGRQSSPPHSAVPHGLWTLDCPHGAKVMLGWLHSHTDQFLAGLSFASVARLLGTDRKRIDAWCQYLAELGLLEVSRGDNGTPNRIILTDAYWALGRVPGAKHPTPLGQNTPGDLGQKTPPEEEHPEDHLENAVATAPTGEPSVAQRANEVSRGYFDWYVKRHGTKPILNFNAIRGLVTKALKAGHADVAVKIALVAMHDAGTPLSAESLDRQLTRPKPGTRQIPTGWREDDEFTYDGANNPVRYPEHEYKRPR